MRTVFTGSATATPACYFSLAGNVILTTGEPLVKPDSKNYVSSVYTLVIGLFYQHRPLPEAARASAARLWFRRQKLFQFVGSGFVGRIEAQCLSEVMLCQWIVFLVKRDNGQIEMHLRLRRHHV